MTVRGFFDTISRFESDLSSWFLDLSLFPWGILAGGALLFIILSLLFSDD